MDREGYVWKYYDTKQFLWAHPHLYSISRVQWSQPESTIVTGGLYLRVLVIPPDMPLGRADVFTNVHRNLEWIAEEKVDEHKSQCRGSNAMGTEICFSMVPSEKGSSCNLQKGVPRWGEFITGNKQAGWGVHRTDGWVQFLVILTLPISFHVVFLLHFILVTFCSFTHLPQLLCLLNFLFVLSRMILLQLSSSCCHH